MRGRRDPPRPRSHPALLAPPGRRTPQLPRRPLGPLLAHRRPWLARSQGQHPASPLTLAAVGGAADDEDIETHLDDVDPTRWLFTVDGEPLYDNATTWRWRATRAAAKLPHVRLHDLRDFYASDLIAAGCDVITVQRALGHSTATTMLNTYSHLWPTAEDRTRSAASDLMRQALTLAVTPETTSGH